jgi:hypothetical protein
MFRSFFDFDGLSVIFYLDDPAHYQLFDAKIVVPRV